MPGLVVRNDHGPVRYARHGGEWPRVARYRHDREDGIRNLAPEAGSLSDRGDGQSRQGAAERRADRGDLAEGEKRPGFSGARLCDSAVSKTRPLLGVVPMVAMLLSLHLAATRWAHRTALHVPSNSSSVWPR